MLHSPRLGRERNFPRQGCIRKDGEFLLINKRAFSLIEMVVAATLLAMATIVAVGSLPACTLMSNQGRFRVAASHRAQSLIEEQRARPWSELPLPPAQVDLGTWVLEGSGMEFAQSMEISQVDTEDPQQLRRVVITLSWRERGRQKSLKHEAILVHLRS